MRLFFVLRLPAVTDDAAIYEALARNWSASHIYGLFLNGKLTPVDLRLPGYPAFLAAIAWLVRRGWRPVMLAQIFIDLATCFLSAAIAVRLVPARGNFHDTRVAQRRVRLAAFCLAALCPFLANYSAAALAEVPATFFTAASLLAFVIAMRQMEESPGGASSASGAASGAAAWFAGGLAVGLGTLMRPETPLALISLGLVLAWRWRTPANWPRLARTCALAGIGFLLPLAPWAIRNAVTLHEFQLLAPRYAQLPGEYVPRGFYSWTATWLTRFRDVYSTIWNLEDKPLLIADMPPSAFDSPEEHARVTALFQQYNGDCCDVTPAWDAQFAQLARERTARHPLRTYFFVPFSRAFTLWFTPRVELLPFTGHLWPLRQRVQQDPWDFGVTVFLGACGFLYVGLALAGFLRGIRIRAPSSAGNASAAPSWG
ncbi:MAG: hypothetical protein ACRD5L_03475, partial [Bryobacteraceae bacterium]